jgi:phage terminase small subunit
MIEDEAGQSEKLTVKQERFANAYVALGCGAEAYRKAYDVADMSAKSVHEAASRLLRNRKVSARVRKIRELTATEYGVTRMGLLLELDEAFAVAKASGKASAMITAVMAKARLCGLDSTPPPPNPSDFFPALSDRVL